MHRFLLLGLILKSFLGFSQTYYGQGGLVNDDGLVSDFRLTVSGLSPATLNETHGLVSVCINMTHDYDGDMNITLVSPSGSKFRLIANVGGGGKNFSHTCFAHDALVTIGVASPPFTGVFKPMGRMGDVNNGKNGNGVWTLRCLDTYSSDQGNLLDWSISFGPHAQTPFILHSSNLPLVFIDTHDEPIVNEPKITAGLKIIDNGDGNSNHPGDTPAYSGTIGIEIRGHFSASLPQKPYAFETRDADGANLNTMLLGMPAENDWVLMALYSDKSLVRNTLASKLFNEMGNYSTRSRYCEVFVNGDYQGIYYLGESIKRDKNRVDIAKLEPSETKGLDVTGGYIIKNDYLNSNSFLSNYHPIDHPSYDVYLVYHYPKPDEMVPEQKEYIAGFINEFEKALYSTDSSNSVSGYRAYADVNSFVDYFIVNELSRNNDGFKKSSYFYKDKDKASGISKLFAGPVWDFDWAFKNIEGCAIFEATDGSGWAHHINDCYNDVNSTGWYVRMMQDRFFQHVLRCRWNSFRTTILDTNSLFKYIDATCLSYLNAAQKRHYENWGHLGANNAAPEVEPIPTTYAGEVRALKEWLKKRLAWLDANIPSAEGVNCDAVTRIEETSEIVVSVFPNPSTTYFFVDGNLAANTHLSLYNQTGHLVFTENINGARVQRIDVSALPDGLYILHLRGDTGKTTFKKVLVAH
jgi:subtilisin-like proprotein convertase family protein